MSVTVDTARPTSAIGRRPASALLTAGAIAGPLYVAVSLAQALTRPGFDLTRHPWSALANGSLGWIQVANLIMTGVLVVGFAAGLRPALGRGRGSRWASRLVGVFGVSLIGAGVFRADPVPGFPVGTPAMTTSWHGLVHLLVGAVGFLCLTVACLLIARRLASTSRAWAAWTAGAGLVFLGAFVGIASGAGSQASIVTFVVAVLVIWTWLTSFAVHLRRRAR